MSDFKKANQFLRNGKYAKALDLYIKKLEVSPSFAPVYQNMSFCFNKMNLKNLSETTLSISSYLYKKEENIKVSVVIPGYKNSNSILRVLKDLNNQTYANFEVIVVSDGCQDVVDDIKGYSSIFELSIYNTCYTQGFGVMLARNLGAAKANGRVLVFLDPDVILPQTFLTDIVSNFEEDTLIIPKINFVDENNHKKIILRENRKGFKDPNAKIQGFATQCCAISRLSFIKLGGFDEKLLGQGGSDTDFGLRHASIYNKAIYLNEVVCHHIGLSSGKKFHVGEKSGWERKIYNFRKKTDFYQHQDNAYVNGGIKYFFSPTWEQYDNKIAKKVYPNFFAVTVVSDLHNYGYKNYLLPSAEFYGIHLETLVADEKAISRKSGSLSEKDRLLLNCLDEVSDDSIIMFLDGYDTVITAEENEIIDKFLSYKAPLVVSAELNCHPDQNLAIQFPSTKFGAKFLNTGGFIGYVWAVKKMIKQAREVVVPNNRKLQLSNQYRWIRVFLEDQSKVKLDNSSKLFFSASTKKESREYKKYDKKYSHTLFANPEFAAEEMQRIFSMIKISDNRVIVNDSGETSCVVHWNGPGALLMKDYKNEFAFLRPWES